MKKRVLNVLMDLVFLIIFNVLFFVAGGTEHTVSTWISYGFIHLSYLLLVFHTFLVPDSKRKDLLQAPLLVITDGYFLISLVINVIFILLDLSGYNLSLIFNVILFGIVLVGIFASMSSNESIKENEERHEEEQKFITSSCLILKRVIDQIENKEVSNEVQRVYDLLHSSPLKSSKEVKDIEQEIIYMVESVESKLKNKDFEGIVNKCKNIQLKIKERNDLLKSMN